MEKPGTARLLHQLLVLYQRVALYFSRGCSDLFQVLPLHYF